MLLTKEMKVSIKQKEVALDAMLLFAQGIDTFTFGGFAKVTGHKDNRHTHAAINLLVQRGVLFKARTLFEDGHYRMTFSRQLTMPLKIL